MFFFCSNEHLKANKCIRYVTKSYNMILKKSLWSGYKYVWIIQIRNLNMNIVRTLISKWITYLIISINLQTFHWNYSISHSIYKETKVYFADCNETSYGPNCESVCSDDCVNSTCNFVSGECFAYKQVPFKWLNTVRTI